MIFDSQAGRPVVSKLGLIKPWSPPIGDGGINAYRNAELSLCQKRGKSSIVKSDLPVRKPLPVFDLSMLSVCGKKLK
jgi:hypothetical protein